MSSSSPSSSPAELVAQWLWRNSKSQHDQQIPSTSLFHESLVLKPLTVLLTEPGRFVCSFRVPAHLTNSSQVLHQGVIASLVDNVGAAAFITLDGKVRVSVDLNVSYVSPAHIDDEVEIEAKVLKYAKPIGVVAVDLTNKTTGQLIAQGRHTMYYSSKL